MSTDPTPRPEPISDRPDTGTSTVDTDTGTGTGTGTGTSTSAVPERSTARRGRGDVGQATTEYALILLAAALVGLLVIAWATAGGAAGRIGQLFDAVVDAVMSRL